jgi:tight adherence protein B
MGKEADDLFKPKFWVALDHVSPIYRPGKVRLIAGAASYAACWGAIGWLFFEHTIGCVLLIAAGGWSSLRQAFQYIIKGKQRVAAQFEQLLFAVASSLQAGKSVENAFRSAETDLRLMYAGHVPLLLKELERLNRAVHHGTPLERAVDDFQRRLDISEVTNWADIFRTCKRTGGDLVQVMRYTSRLIVEKMNMERELAVLIAGKRLEAKALSVVPFLMIAAFRYGSPDYMAPLYQGGGHLVMSVALLLIVSGILLSSRLMRIEV